MRKKILMACGITVVIVILAASVYLILKNVDTTMIDVMFKNNPYKKGYNYECSGSIDAKLDSEKAKSISGISEDDTGQAFIDILSNNVASMNMKIDANGTCIEKEILRGINLKTETSQVMDSRSYTDGKGHWVYTSYNGEEAKWEKSSQTSGIMELLSNINIEEFEKFKNSIGLIAQDENSSTFLIKVTGNIIEPMFGAEGKDVIGKLASGDDFNQFVRNMNMVVTMKTSDRVNFFTPYVKISNVKVLFTLPADKMSELIGTDKIGDFGPDEKKVFSAIMMKANFEIDFKYKDIKMEKPKV